MLLHRFRGGYKSVIVVGSFTSKESKSKIDMKKQILRW